MSFLRRYFSGHCLVAFPAPVPAVVAGVCPGCAGVEEIVWLGVVRACFWVPGSPPMGFVPRVASVVPVLRRVPRRGSRGRGSGAWRFENWIVDASEKGGFVPSLYRCIFRSNFIFGVVRRSFCDHFRCDDLSSGNLLIGRLRVPHGCVGCLQGRMVDALADRTDEGRWRLR